MSVRTIGRLTRAKVGACRRAGDAPSWKVRAATAAVAACFAGSAYPNPTGPAVVSGSATIQSQGNVLSITNSPNAIINWQSFSIGANEITRFIQQNASSAVLNRVIGQDPSAILGALQSNGRVFLINPNGIAFGPNATIDVAGLVASTLNMADADFLAGRLKFQQTLGAGGINNQGNIVTPAGGQVYLIAPNIENSGLIKSPQGEIILAAGQSVELVDVGTPDLRVQITAPDNQAINLGQIVADSGRIGVYAGLIRHAGTASADTVAVGDKGQIIFKATKDIALDPGSKVSASGAPGGVHDGGEVRIIADGTLNMRQGSEVRVDGGADGGNGGFLELSGKERIALNGEYTGRARAEGYRNGSLLLDPDRIVICDPGECGGPTPVSLGEPGSIAAGDSPGQTLYLETNMTEGGWTNVSLEANNQIRLLSLLENSDIPDGGSLTLRTLSGDILLDNDIGTFQARFEHELILAAGQDIQFNASIYQGTPAITATAGRDVQVNGTIDLGGGNLSATAGRDVVVSGDAGGYVYSGTTSNVALTGANVKLLGGEFGSAQIITQGDVTLTGTQSVLLQGGGCGEVCADAYVDGNNVKLAGGAVTLAGGADPNGGGEASVSANDLVAVTGSSLTLAGGESGEFYGYANASLNGSRVTVDVTGGVTVQGGNAVGSQGSGGSASASLRGDESVAINAGGAVNVLGGTASGTGYYDARAEISGDSVTINGASLLVQGGTAQANGDSYNGGNADASARIAATNANLTFAGAAILRGGTASGNDGSAQAQAEISGSSYQGGYAVGAEVIEQPLPNGPFDGGVLTLKADSILLQGGQANAQAGGESSAYADAYAAISDFGAVDIQAAKGVGLAAGLASATAAEFSEAQADASATVFAENLVKVTAGGSIQAVAGTAAAADAGIEISFAEASADAGLSAGMGSIVTDSAGIKLQGGNVTGEGSAVALMVAAADVNATIRGAGTIDLVPGNDSLGAYAAVVAAPATIYLNFPGRFAGGFTPAGITNGTTGFFTSDDPQSLANLTPAVLGQTLIVSYGLLPPVFPPPGEGGLELPNNIFVDETNNATNFNVGGNNLPLLDDEDDGKPKRVCS